MNLIKPFAESKCTIQIIVEFYFQLIHINLNRPKIFSHTDPACGRYHAWWRRAGDVSGEAVCWQVMKK